MSRIELTPPDDLLAWLDARSRATGFEDSAAYLADLLASARAADARLDEWLLEGIRSGEPIPVDEIYKDRKWKELEEKLARAAKAS